MLYDVRNNAELHDNGVEFNSSCHELPPNIGCVGTPILALAEERNSVPTLTPSLLQMWIDFCASFLNLAECEPEGPAQKKVLWGMTERVRTLDIASRL